MWVYQHCLCQSEQATSSTHVHTSTSIQQVGWLHNYLWGCMAAVTLVLFNRYLCLSFSMSVCPSVSSLFLCVFSYFHEFCFGMRMTITLSLMWISSLFGCEGLLFYFTGVWEWRGGGSRGSKKSLSLSSFLELSQFFKIIINTVFGLVFLYNMYIFNFILDFVIAFWINSKQLR